MSALERARQIADRIEDARRTLKRLTGDRYDAKVVVWVDQVRYLAMQLGCDVLQVPLRVNVDRLNPSEFLWLLAGVAEAIERDGGAS